jgi:hypothetical protein
MNKNIILQLDEISSIKSERAKVMALLKILKSSSFVADKELLLRLFIMFDDAKTSDMFDYIEELVSSILIYIKWQGINYTTIHDLINELLSFPDWDPYFDIFFTFVSSKKHSELYNMKEVKLNSQKKLTNITKPEQKNNLEQILSMY